MKTSLLRAARALRRSPGFATTVVLTLALGIAATTTMFSVVDHVLLRPLFYPDANDLVLLYQRGTSGTLRLVSFPTLEDWARDDPSFAGMSWLRGTGGTLSTPAGPTHTITAYASHGFFRVMGTKPLLGRTFTPDEETAGGPPVVVLSFRLWQSAFAGDSAVIGRSVTIDSISTVVIGIMPKEFEFPNWAQLWLPLAPHIARDSVAGRRDYHVDSKAIGRLAAGVSVEQAERALARAQARVIAAYPAGETDWTNVSVVPLRDEVVGDVRPALTVLGGAVGLLLLLVGVNVANLAGLRGAVRWRDFAIRTALGASRGALVRGLLAEYALLASIGCALGVWLSFQGVAWLRATDPFEMLGAGDSAVDWRAVVVAVGTSWLMAVLVGVVPAMRGAAERASAEGLLGSRSGGANRAQVRARTLLTASQFALALLLLVGTGLLIQSYRRLAKVTLGFEPHNLLAMTVSPDRDPAYVAPRATLGLYERLVTQLRTVPGVEDAAVVNFLPLGGAGIPTALELPNRPVSSEDRATYLTVSEGYLRTAGLRLVAGRWFSPAEMRAPGDGIVVSESVARRYWRGAGALGQRITIHRSSQNRKDFGEAVPSVVIGVVGDVRQFGLEAGPDQAVYVPLAAEPWPWATVIVRVRTESVAMRAALSRAVRGVDAGLMALRSADEGRGFDPLDGSVSESLAPRRYLLGFVTAFSVCALLLAALGVYGVMSYSMARRTHEVGIRMALGATARDVLGMVLRQGILVAGIGCGAGIVGAVMFSRVLSHELYDTSPLDPVVLLVTPLVLIGVGAAAAYLPARRATRVDPAIALHSE